MLTTNSKNEKVMKKIFQKEDFITKFTYLTQEKFPLKNLEQ